MGHGQRIQVPRNNAGLKSQELSAVKLDPLSRPFGPLDPRLLHLTAVSQALPRGTWECRVRGRKGRDEPHSPLLPAWSQCMSVPEPITRGSQSRFERLLKSMRDLLGTTALRQIAGAGRASKYLLPSAWNACPLLPPFLASFQALGLSSKPAFKFLDMRSHLSP